MQVILAVEDVARAAAFYDEAFGWPRNPLVDFGNYVEYLIPEGGALGVYQRDGFAGEVGAEPVAAEGGRVSQAYVYFPVDDVEATAAAIEAAGGRALSPLAERAWGEHVRTRTATSSPSRSACRRPIPQPSRSSSRRDRRGRRM